MKWSEEDLRKLSQEQRYDLWNNAKRLGAVELSEAIEKLGLPYGDPAGLKLDSPLGRAIAKIINSKQGQSAALEAARNGLPALEGVDPLLQASLGDEYKNSYEATIQAGYLVAKAMRKLGFEDSGRNGKLSGQCVAKTGQIYVKSE